MKAISELLHKNDFNDSTVVIIDILVKDQDVDGSNEVMIGTNLSPLGVYLDETYHMVTVLYPTRGKFIAVPKVRKSLQPP